MSACYITGLYPTALITNRLYEVYHSYLPLITINTLKLFILLDGFCLTA